MRLTRPHWLTFTRWLALAACGDDTHSQASLDAGAHDAARTFDASAPALDATTAPVDATVRRDATLSYADAGFSCDDLHTRAQQAYENTISNASRACQSDADCGHVALEQWCVVGCGYATLANPSVVQGQLEQTVQPYCDAYFAQQCPALADLPCVLLPDDGGPACVGGQCIEAL